MLSGSPGHLGDISLPMPMHPLELIFELGHPCRNHCSKLISQWSSSSALSKWIVAVEVVKVFHILHPALLLIQELLVSSLIHLSLELLSILILFHHLVVHTKIRGLRSPTYRTSRYCLSCSLEVRS